MTAARVAAQNCSIARTLAVVGDRWTMLVIRELALGRSRFGDIRTELRIATNILTDRLQTLLEHGLVTRTPVTAPGQVHDYALTDKGQDLVPVLVALSQWGDKHAAGPLGPPRLWWHTSCNHNTNPYPVCDHCQQPVKTADLRVVPGPGADDQQRRDGLRPTG